jgi:hypothetical protein
MRTEACQSARTKACESAHLRCCLLCKLVHTCAVVQACAHLRSYASAPVLRSHTSFHTNPHACACSFHASDRDAPVGAVHSESEDDFSAGEQEDAESKEDDQNCEDPADSANEGPADSSTSDHDGAEQPDLQRDDVSMDEREEG